MRMFSKLFRAFGHACLWSAPVLGVAGSWHAGYGAYRKSYASDLAIQNVPLDAQTLQDLQKGLDALNGPAYATGEDKIYGSRAPEYTQGWMGEISERVRHQFEVLDVVSCQHGELEGLHMALVRDKATDNNILAVCGMEPGEIVHDVDDVFNTLYLTPPSLPDQFPPMMRAFDELESQHGKIDLVAGHSIGGMLVQLFAASGRTKVVAFASAGIDSGQISDVANYFNISEEEAMANMKGSCVSVGSSFYSALGEQVGPTYWATSPFNPNAMDHGTYQIDGIVHKGELSDYSNEHWGALMPGVFALCLSVGVGVFAKKKFLKPETPSL